MSLTERDQKELDEARSLSDLIYFLDRQARLLEINEKGAREAKAAKDAAEKLLASQMREKGLTCVTDSDRAFILHDRATYGPRFQVLDIKSSYAVDIERPEPGDEPEAPRFTVPADAGERHPHELAMAALDGNDDDADGDF